MERYIRTDGWWMVTRWSIITSLGWAVCWSPLLGVNNSMLQIWALTSGSWDITYPILSWLGGLTTGALGGVIIGVGQGRILQEWWQHKTRWAFLTTVGLGLGWSISQFLLYLALPTLRLVHDWKSGKALDESSTLVVILESAAFVGVVVGISVGVFQWLALRKQVFDAWRWPIACGLGWVGGSVAYWALYTIYDGRFCQTLSCLEQRAEPEFYWVISVAYIAGGLVVGGITGAASRLLLSMRSLDGPISPP